MSTPTTFEYIMCQASANDAGAAQVGGRVQRYTSTAALKKGDVVFCDALAAVNKSAVTANYAGFVGVVVGGNLTNGALDAANGTTVSSAGGWVIVQIDGEAYMQAEGTITVGTTKSVICTGTTAGLVIAGTTAGQMLGTPLESASSGGYFRCLIRHR